MSKSESMLPSLVEAIKAKSVDEQLSFLYQLLEEVECAVDDKDLDHDCGDVYCSSCAAERGDDSDFQDYPLEINLRLHNNDPRRETVCQLFDEIVLKLKDLGFNGGVPEYADTRRDIKEVH